MAICSEPDAAMAVPERALRPALSFVPFAEWTPRLTGWIALRVLSVTMMKRILSAAVLSTLCGCGGQTTSDTGSTRPAPGGGGAPAGAGGSSAGQGGTSGVDGGSAGKGANGGMGGFAGANNGGSSGAAGGVAGAAGAGGMCPDFQAGFAGGPAVPELAPEGPSCAGGITCAGRSCCESIRMPGGLLHLGTDCPATCDPDSVCPEPYPAETPETNVIVTPFALDTFLVTVGRFRKFVDVYDGAPIPTGAGADASAAPLTNTLSGWRAEYNQHLFADANALRVSLKYQWPNQPGGSTWTDTTGPNENKPINTVDWYHAFAFCIWDGGWLPIEATWEYAAAGGAEDRLYPWGQPLPDGSRVPGSCLNSLGPCDATTLPNVGAFPAGSGKWGHLDLTGYLGQWTQDGWHLYGAKQGVPNCNQPECFNVFSPTQSLGAVVRGGGGIPSTAATNANRSAAPADPPDRSIGFRCARH